MYTLKIFIDKFVLVATNSPAFDNTGVVSLEEEVWDWRNLCSKGENE